MPADVATSLKDWSTTASSNSPSGSTAISTNLDDNLRQIQTVVRYLAASDSIASATTTDIGSKDATFLTISGTTTITGLGTVSAGIYKWAIFSGALTLTHNGTSLILPTGANISTAAGDIAVFLSLGSGNWRCLAYLPVRGTYPAGDRINTLGTSGSVTVNTALAETHLLVPTGNVTSMSFTNPLPSGQLSAIAVLVEMGATAYTVAWPAAVKWPGGSIPALSGANKKDLFTFISRDGGSTWLGAVAGRGWA